LPLFGKIQVWDKRTKHKLVCGGCFHFVLVKWGGEKKKCVLEKKSLQGQENPPGETKSTKVTSGCFVGLFFRNELT